MIYLAAQTAMCAPELSAMLACWAASGDLHNRALCKETAEQLFQCMRTTVRSMSFCIISLQALTQFIRVH